MNEMEKIIMDILKSIVGNRFTEEIGLDTSLTDDLGFESISVIRLIIELENAFDISISDVSDEINFSEINKVSDVVKLVSFVKNRNK